MTIIMNREEYEVRKATERKRAFLEAVQPILRVAANNLALYNPNLVLYPVGTRYAGVERSYSTRREAWQALNLRKLMEVKS